MNMEGSNRWEINLGFSQLVAVVALTVGCAFGAYYVGFFAGRNAGFEVARAASTAELAKVPVPALAEDEEQAQSDSGSIYARLDDKYQPPADKTSDSHTAQKSVPVPDSVQAVPSEALIKKEVDGQNGTTTTAADIANAFKEHVEEKEAKVNDQVTAGSEPVPAKVRVLGDDNGSKSKTLGMLLDERVANARKDEHKASDIPPAVKQLEAQPTSAPEPTKAAVKPTVAPTTKPDSASKLDDSKSKKDKEKEKDKDKDKSVPAGMDVRAVLPSGWFAQIAAPKQLSEAESMVKRLKKSGFPVIVEKASVRGESYYRVVVGPETSKVQAERLIDQLQRESYIKSAPFLRRTK